MLVWLIKHYAAEGPLVREEGIDRDSAVGDNSVHKAQFGGPVSSLINANVDADFGRALLPYLIAGMELVFFTSWFLVAK